jgi:hypothetical protein
MLKVYAAYSAIIVQIFYAFFFTLYLPVAMTHYLDLWHLKTVKTAIFISYSDGVARV